jgi:hypothetical protein
MVASAMPTAAMLTGAFVRLVAHQPVVRVGLVQIVEHGGQL